MQKLNDDRKVEIELLIQERNLLVKQLEDAHRMNLVLTRAIDENKENVVAADQMKQRIDSLNRAMFNLLDEKLRLEEVVRSYAINVANEHNYFLNRAL